MAVKGSKLKFMILLLLMFSLIVETGGLVSMCTNGTYTATNYQLGRTQNDPKNCTCLLISTEKNKNTKVIFNIDIFSGCNYKLAFYSNGILQFLSCDSFTSVPVFGTLKSEIIKLNLEPYRLNSIPSTFTVNITSQPETNLSLTCFVQEIRTSPTQLPTSSTPSSTIITPSTTSPSFPTSSIPSSTTSSATTSITPATPSTSEFQSTSTVSNIVTKSSTSLQTTTSTTRPAQTLAGDFSSTPTTSSGDLASGCTVLNKGEDQTVGIAIGCFICGIVCGVIALLGFQWFRQKRLEKKELYSSPTPTNRDIHTYASIVPGTGVQNSSTTEDTTPTSSATQGEATAHVNSSNNPSVTYQNIPNQLYSNT